MNAGEANAEQGERRGLRSGESIIHRAQAMPRYDVVRLLLASIVPYPNENVSEPSKVDSMFRPAVGLVWMFENMDARPSFTPRIEVPLTPPGSSWSR
ncbi:MAG: hypothetical protein IPN24_17580 [Betaproteobacteria bacterium]|nr:hypothetical protein [Betaproteobacteria bacterium]